MDSRLRCCPPGKALGPSSARRCAASFADRPDPVPGVGVEGGGFGAAGWGGVKGMRKVSAATKGHADQVPRGAPIPAAGERIHGTSSALPKACILTLTPADR